MYQILKLQFLLRKKIQMSDGNQKNGRHVQYCILPVPILVQVALKPGITEHLD